MPNHFAQLTEASSVRAVIDAIQDISAEQRVTWRAVGDNENNLATINLGTDPAAGLIERITNALDGVLEREWVERGQPTDIPSPRAAVEQWFGIPQGRLVNIENLRDAELADLSQRVEVTLRDSESVDRPTVEIRDAGIGIKAGDFARSILSLQGTRKLRKLFLAGAFGQGGSTALSYSQFTIILSRALTQNGDGVHPVAATVVRFNPGDLQHDKHGVYEYVVDHGTGAPLTFDVPIEEFPVGTLVRHVAMDLGKYKNILTAPTGSLWYLAHHYLFDPVLPYRISEQRENSSQGSTRTVAGNHRLLTHADTKEYEREAARTFRSGTVRIKWWVLSAEGEASRNRITQYTLASKPIVITYNGQKQGELPNTIFKNDLRLPYLERYIVVHVDCDRLDNESRRQLFPTTRESLRDTAILSELRDLVVDTLAGDPELRRLDRERKDRYVRRMESESVENIRRRLASRVRSALTVGTGGRSPRVVPPANNSEREDRPAIPVQEPPTLLEIVNPEPRKVYAGKRFIIRFRTDADPGYFLNPDHFLAIVDPPTFGQYTGTTNVRDGYGTAYFHCVEDVAIGTMANISLEVRPRRASTLTAEIGTEVVELPTEGGTGSGRLQTPNINPQWVQQGDSFWQENNWSDRNVATVVRTDESIDVFVSAENRHLNKLIERAQRRSTGAVDSIRDFYLEHISFYAVLAALQQEEPQTDGAETPEVQDQAREQELRRACEMLVGVIETMFEVVATEGERAGSDNGVVPDGEPSEEELVPATGQG